MKDFNNQILPINEKSHGEYHISSNIKFINGLVFASFVNDDKKSSDKEEFYERIIKTAKEEMKNIDLSNVNLKKGYDDIEVILLDKSFYVSLRIGLWF